MEGAGHPTPPELALTHLRQHLRQLVHVAQQLAQENQTLRHTVQQQQQELSTQADVLLRLRSERDSLKLAVESAPERTAQLKQQINELIAQIDGTLAQLPPDAAQS